MPAGTEGAEHEFLNDLLAAAESALRCAREAGGDQVAAGESGRRPAGGQTGARPRSPALKVTEVRWGTGTPNT